MNEILPPAWRGLTVTVAHTDRSVNQADPLAILQVPGSRHETLRSNQPRPSGAVRGQGRPHTLVQGPFCRILFQRSKSLKRSFHCAFLFMPIDLCVLAESGLVHAVVSSGDKRVR